MRQTSRRLRLSINYTAKPYVIWLNDPRIKDALEFLKSILTDATKYVFRLKLKPGSGLVGNPDWSVIMCSMAGQILKMVRIKIPNG